VNNSRSASVGPARFWRSAVRSIATSHSRIGWRDHQAAIGAGPRPTGTRLWQVVPSLALADWAAQHGVALEFIKPGQPMQNGFMERFNRSYREAVLDMFVFQA
jgi:transposase InsO family protein